MDASGKIGRMSKEQPGQIAGAGESRVADKILVTKVAWAQAILSRFTHAEGKLPGNSRMR